MKIGEILKKYLEETNTSVRTFASRSGLSSSYISSLTNGTLTNPSLEAFSKIANGMGIDSQRLFDELDNDQMFEVNSNIPSNTVPLYSAVSCGTGLFVDDVIEDFIAIPDRFIKRGKEYFAMPAKGDSMIGKGIVEGDILVFEKTQSLENGQIGCFCVDNNCAVCKVYRVLSSGAILLESANNKYDPIEVDVLKDCFRIIGKYICRFTV